MTAGVLFDFDDTLVETTIYFNMAKDMFAGIMEGLGFPPEEALTVLNRFDIENVQKCGGFFKQCFPEALGRTYEFYCKSYGVPQERLRRKEIEDLGWWVFSQPARPLPGAEGVLSSLHGRFPLFLATKGDPGLQYERVRGSGLSRWFNRIYVLTDKSRDTYIKIASEQNLRPVASWVVGNSMKSDINPARTAGFNCIYVHHPHTWDYEEEVPVGGHVSVEYLSEVPRVLDRRAVAV